MKNFIVFVSIVALSLLTGCSAAINAAKHSKMSVDTQLTTSIFLPPIEPGQKVLVHITNTSRAKIDIDQAIQDVLRANGLEVVTTESEADICIVGDLRHFGKPLYINGMADGMKQLRALSNNATMVGTVANVGRLGGFNGGFSSLGSPGIGAGVSAMTGLASAGVEKAFEVKELAGVVDLEFNHKATGKVVSTQVVVTVRQTNLNEIEALDVVRVEVANTLAELLRKQS